MKSNPPKTRALPGKRVGPAPDLGPTHRRAKTTPEKKPILEKKGGEAAAWAQAKRKVAKPDVGLNPAPDEPAAERERWDPLPGSTGHKVHVPSGDDEDDEGRSDTERLVERGVKDAGRDQTRAAAGESD